MRDRHEIQIEIDTAQERLTRHLAELKAVLADKVDVKARVQRRVEDTRTRARDLYAQARQFVHDKPLVTGVVVGAVALAVIGAFTVRRWIVGPRPTRLALPAGSSK